jgi:hypothetical protein
VPLVGTITVSVKEALLLSAPETPLTVMGKLPTVAVLLAVKVTRLVPVVPGAANAVVTPLGRPDADSVTLLLKPFCAVIVTILAADAPRGSPRVAGSRDSVKFGAVMVRTIFVVLLSAPEEPVTVTVAVPAVAVLLALKVRELVPVVLDGLNAAVTPLGSPETPRATIPLKPFCPATLILLLPLPARGTVRLLGEDKRLKLGTTTVNAMVVAPLRLPEVPVMVSG